MRTEYAALSALSCGALLGTVGLSSATLSTIALGISLVGVALLWFSMTWSTIDKVVGMMLIPVGFWVIELIHYAHRTNASDFIELVDRALIVMVVVTDVMVSIGALAYLVVRLRRETQTRDSI